MDSKTEQVKNMSVAIDVTERSESAHSVKDITTVNLIPEGSAVVDANTLQMVRYSY